MPVRANPGWFARRPLHWGRSPAGSNPSRGSGSGRVRRGRVARLAALTAGSALLVGLGLGTPSSAASARASGQASAVMASGRTASSSSSLSARSVAPVRTSGGAVVPVLRWRSCGRPYLCASARVPLDWSRPRGQLISLALVKLPATDARHRIGSLFVNPGGPGGSGVDLVRQSPEAVPAAVRRQFDLIGFDPRFIGGSRPAASCMYDDAFSAFAAAQPSFPVTPTQEVAFASAQAGYTARCGQRADLAYASTASVARDLDLLRAAVGDARLSYVGFSYGSYLGQMYAQLYPTRVRAIVLDGVVDAAAWTSGTGADWRFSPFSARLGSAEASSQALHEFFRLCSAAGSVRCSLAKQPDPAQAFRRLADRLLQAPVDLGNGDLLDYPSLVNATASVLYGPMDWQGYADELESTYETVMNPSAATTVVAAPRQAAGPGATQLLADVARELAAQRGIVAATAIRGRGATGPRFERPRPTPPATVATPTPADNPVAGFDAVSCEDGLNPDEIWHWVEAADEQERLAPYFGRAWTWSGAACATWTLTDPNTYRGPFGRPTSAPILVVGNRFDPATPYAGAVATAQRFPGARLLTINGYGHTSGAAPSRCADAAVSAYLLRGRLPKAGAVCRQDVPPFPP